jgi:hypothetical protein
MAEDQLEAEDLLKILVREIQRLKRFGQDLWKLLTPQKQRRVGIERGVIEDRWGPDPYSPEGVQDRTARLERDAARAEQQVRDLEERNQDLQNDLDRERDRDRDRELNNDRDRDGIDDRVENRTDLDRDHRDDATERRDETDRENEDANDRDGDGVDDAVERREDERAREDEERRKREEQDRQQNREDGIDPATAAGAAVGAAVVAEEIDDQQDEQRAEDLQQEQQEQRDVDAEADQRDPASEADNQQQTETDTGQDGLDPTERNLDQDGSEADADNALDESSVDADNAVEDPSAEADNLSQDEQGLGDQQDTYLDQSAGQDSPGAANERVVEWDNERDGSHLELNSDQEWDGTVYQTGENGPSLTVHGGEQDQQRSGSEVAGPEQGGTQSAEAVNIDRIDGQTFTVDQGGVQFADQNGAQNEATVGADGGQRDDLAQDHQVPGPGQEVPAQQPQQVQAQTVDAPEQGADQVPQAQGPNTQQIANASQTAVDETAGLGQDGQDGQDGQSPGGQTEARSTSQAQGTQWRPPEQAAEDPAIDAAKAHKNGRPSGPGPELPPDEKAKFDHVRADQKPLTAVKVNGGSVAAGERPGTGGQLAAQRTADRNDRGRGDDGGRSR